MVTADLLSLIVTWKRTFRQWKTSVRLGLRSSLSGRLLRDGNSKVTTKEKNLLTIDNVRHHIFHVRSAGGLHPDNF